MSRVKLVRAVNDYESAGYAPMQVVVDGKTRAACKAVAASQGYGLQAWLRIVVLKAAGRYDLAELVAEKPARAERPATASKRVDAGPFAPMQIRSNETERDACRDAAESAGMSLRRWLGTVVSKAAGAPEADDLLARQQALRAQLERARRATAAR